MSNNKQSSVEMMWDEIDNLIPFKDSTTGQKFCAILEKYKAIHRVEQQKAYNQCFMSNFQTFDQYYAGTFGDKQQ